MPEKKYKYIVGIINNKEHNEENKSIEDMLKSAGLKGRIDYILSPLPPSFAEVYPVPVLWVRKNNVPELEYEKFFGKESIELFLKRDLELKVASSFEPFVLCGRNNEETRKAKELLDEAGITYRFAAADISDEPLPQLISGLTSFIGLEQIARVAS